MNKRLHILSFLLLAFLLITNINLSAEIIYTDLDPDETISPNAGSGKNFRIDINQNGWNDFGLQVNNLSPGVESVKISGYTRENQIAGLGDTNDVKNFNPSAFSIDDEIGENQTIVWHNDWDDQFDHDLPLTILGYGIIKPGPWSGGTVDKYLGVRVKRGDNYHYGWIGIDIPAGSSSCTVKDFAYENTPGKSIKAGDKGESTTQESLEIKYGLPAVVDGVISDGEWSEAESIKISINETTKVTVYVKHDSTSLFFAFLDNLGSMNFRFPEILIDVNNDKSANWQMDDWWFHTSMTNCHSQGTHSGYTNCKTVQPDWEANNFASSMPDTIEIRIPFDFINLDISSVGTIGLGFDVTNTSSAWEFWPEDADIDKPSTWANAVFVEGGTGISESDGTINPVVNVYPNPFSNQATIEYILTKPTPIRINIYNSLGAKVTVIDEGLATPGTHSSHFNSQNLIPGIYYYSIQLGDSIESGKMILVR